MLPLVTKVTNNNNKKKYDVDNSLQRIHSKFRLLWLKSHPYPPAMPKREEDGDLGSELPSERVE